MADPVEDLLASSQGHDNNFRLSLHSAVEQNPDKSAGYNALARRFKVPPTAVAQDPAVLEQRARAQDAISAAADTIALKEHVANTPGFAAASHDDVGVLAKLEDVAKAPFNWLASGVDTVLANDKPLHAVSRWHAYTKGSSKDLADPVNSLKSFWAGTTSTAAGAAGSVAQVSRRWDEYGPFAWAERKLFGGSVEGGLADFFTGVSRSIARYSKEQRPDLKSGFAKDVLSGVESVPGSLTAAGITLSTGNPVAGAAFMGATTSGSSYVEAIDSGASHDRADVKAIIDGLIEAGTEYLPEKFLLGDAEKAVGFRKFLADQLTTEIPGEQLATLGQDFNQWAMLDKNKGKSFDDYAKEIMPHAWSTLVATVVTSASIAGAGNLAKRVTGIAARAERRQQQAEHAQAVAEHLTNLGKLTATSKLRERDTTSFQSFLADATEGTDIEDIYIAPQQLGEVLNQSGLDEEQQKAVADAIGPRIAEAVQQGTDVRIPTSEFATLLAGTPAEKQLLEHAKVDPNGMTKAEAEEYMQTEGEALRKSVEEQIQKLAQDDEKQGHFEAVKSGILEQLNTARRFTPAVNESYATMMASAYATMAERANMTASDLWARMPVRIQAQGVTGQTFDQRADQTDTPEFKNWFGNSKVTDAAGKPLRVFHGTNQPMNVFKRERGGKATGANAGATLGFFFTDNTEEAGQYAANAGGTTVAGAEDFEKKSAELHAKVIRLERQAIRTGDWAAYEAAMQDWEALEIGATQEDSSTGQNVLPVYLAMQNPKVVDMKGEPFFGRDIEAIVADAKANGFDGVVLQNIKDAPKGGITSNHYVVFDPTQIKSAIGNNGQFDPNDPNILHQSDFAPREHGIPKAAGTPLAPFTNAEQLKAQGVTGERLDQNGGATEERRARAIEQGFLTTDKFEALKNGGVRSQGVAGSPATGDNGGGAGSTGEDVPAPAGVGNLITFYHGTRDTIYEGFDPEHPNKKDAGWLGKGVYVTDDAQVAGTYAELKAGRGNPNVIPLHVKLENPLVGDLELKRRLSLIAQNDPEAIAEWTDKVRAAGYDGVLLTYPEGQTEAVVFDPANVRSVNAQFDPSRVGQNDLLFQSDTVFYSALERAVENTKTTRASGEQWLATLSKTPGVKKEELEWTGLPEWLQSQDGPISRDEVLAFVREGGVQVEEVVLGGVSEEALNEKAMELREAWEQEQLEDWEPPEVYVDYPSINVSEEDEDGDPVEWEVEGVYFGSEEAAQAHADDIASEREQEAQEALPTSEEQIHARGADRWLDFLYQARDALEGDGGAKFESYTEHGGEDYGELLLTVPPGVRGNPEKGYYHRGHFSDQPVIAHIRFKSRKSADGRDVMFIEEVQSDWHQQGREKGYATAPDEAKIAEARAALEKAQMALDIKVERLRATLKGHSDAGILREIERTKKILASGKSLDEMGGIPVDVLEGDLARMKAELDGFGAARLKQSAARTINLTEVTTEETKALIAALEAVRDAEEEHAVAERELNDLAHPRNNIPDAPFKSTPAWAGLAMKRAIRWAADNGFDQVAWTTGEQQAERYNQLMTLDSVVVTQVLAGEDRYLVDAGYAVTSAIVERNLGDQRDASTAYMSAAQIREVFGADLGGRMIKLAGEAVDEDGYGNRVLLEGEDLKLGGEGMKAFYDKMLPNITKDIIKKYGSAVRPLAVEGMGASQEARAKALEADIQRKAGLAAYDVTTRAEAAERFAEWDKMEREGIGAPEKIAQFRALLTSVLPLIDQLDAIKSAAAEPTNLGFDITPELKDAANSGFALFQKERGAYSPATDTITLLQHADLSTFLHESGHFFLEMMHRLATDPAAPQQIVDDWKTTLKWFGVSEADWQGYTLEQKREYHEKWARGFEAYLFTGKAPSMRLQSIFGRFRSWLMRVYTYARNLGVQPSPEIRGVFDRMLATDREISEMEAARSMAPMFENREQSGMDPLQWAEYQRQGQAATDEAVSDLQTRGLRDMQWLTNAKGREIAKLKRKAAATRAAVRKEVAAEVMAEPVYRARLFLTKGLLDGEKVDGPHRLSIPEVDALYGDTPALKTIKDALGYGAYGMLSAENGVHPEQLAELFGFTSADHLIRELMAAEPMNDKIDGMTEQRMLEQHGELTDEKAIEDAANAAIHNEARAKFVATELAALNAMTGKTKILTKAAKQFAAETIARLKIRNIKPSLYEAAAARAAKASQEAFAKGERQTAAAEKRNQLVNTYAAKAAIKAKDEVQKALDYFERLGSPAAAKKIDPEYMAQIDALLATVELRRSRSLRSIDSAISLAEWIEQQRDLGFEPTVTPEMAAVLAARKSYKQLTVEELRGLVDAVKNIEHLGRLKNRLLTAKKDRDFQTAVGEAVGAIQTNATSTRNLKLEPDGSVKEKVHKGILDFLALHRKFASVIRQMDGFKDGGTLWELFVRPMNAAGDREASMRAEATKKLAEILKPVLGKQMAKKVYIPEIGASLSLQGRLAIALNMGNSINRERVLMGDNWTQGQLDAVLSTLTAEQWQTVQQVWDYINSFWPQIAAKEQRVTGVVPEKVEAEPLRVVTADGQTLDLAGGYYPIKYDADRSSKAEADTAAEIAQQFTRGLYSRATTRRGHTKARVETVKRPVRKDLGVVVQHLSEVIHDLAWHEYLIDATRLLRAAPIDAAIRQHYGPETLRAMRNALTDMAAGDVPAANVFERSVNYLRTGATVAGMGWSMSTALLQPLGLSQSMKRIGVKWVGRGMGRWLKDAATMQNTVAWINAQSEFMRTRAMTQQREISEIQNKVNDRESAFQASFFYMIQKLQMIADVPTWVGQYEKSIASGESHERAVALADQAVLDAQGGGQIKDLAGIQRGGPLQKLWTNFYSYFSTTYNLMAESIGEARLTGNYGRLAVDTMLLTILPATLAYLMRHALRGDVPDDPEELAKALAKENASYLFGMMVGLRDIEAAAVEGDESPAGLAFLGNLARFGKQVQQMELDAALLKATNATAGVVFHYPAGQVQRTAQGFEAIAEGRTYNPMALLLGPPAEAK